MALIGLLVLDAWFFAVVAGVGLTLFQRVVPRPGLSSGLFLNTRRLGAIAFGAIISLPPRLRWYTAASLPCAALTVLALVAIGGSGQGGEVVENDRQE